jgi:uncharacterized repeat protein (TIGR01451 family)
MSRGSIYALGAGARKGFVLFWTALLLASLLLQYSAFVAPATSLAANSSNTKVMGGFEIDGDFPANTADDWANSANSGAGLVDGPTVQDPISADPTVLATGVSDADPVTDWAYTSAQAPQKADIGNVYAVNRVFSGDQWAYVGIERQSGQGTVQYDLEFNKLGNRKLTNGVSVPNRSPGDLLFTATQTGGGGWTINATVQHWTGAWDTGSWSAPVAISTSLFYGLANQFDAPHPTSWPDALGSTVPSNQFAEMAMDVSAIAADFIGCPGYGTLNIRSISSTGSTPELKDVVDPIPLNLSTCGSLSWKKQDDAGNALGGAVFTVTPNPWTGTSSIDIADLTSGSPASNHVDQDNRDGYFKLIDVIPDTYQVKEKTAPAGYLVDPTVQSTTVSDYENASFATPWKDPAFSHPSLTTSLNGGSDASGKSTLTINLGASGTSATFSDSASFGSTNANHKPTGTVTYSLYDNNACTAPALDTSTVTINANGTIPDSKTFTVSGTGTWYVAATYGGDNFNASAASGCADETVNVVQPNIVAHKSVDKTTANPGDKLSYTITIQNNGKGAASGVTATDDISNILAHSTYNGDLAASAGTAGYDAGTKTISWSGNIAAGATVTLTFSATLDTVFPSGTTHLDNTVVVTGRGSNCAADSVDPACSTDTTVNAAPVLTAEKTVKVHGTSTWGHTAAASTGDTLDFRIHVDNSGNANATNRTVTDVLSYALVANSAPFDTATCNLTCSYDAGTHTITWTGIGILAGSSIDLTFSVKLNDAFPTGTTHLPNVVILAGSNCGEGSSDSKCSTDTTVTAAPSLALTKEVSVAGGAFAHSGSAQPGDKLTYRLTIKNTGNADATGQSVTDDLSSVLAHAAWNGDAAASSGSAAFSSPNLTWSGITIAANGGTATLTFSVTLASTGWTAGTTDLPNTAVEADSTNCPSAAGAAPECSADTTVTTGTDLRITKSVDPTTIPGGSDSSVSYTLVVSNAGNGATTTDVVVYDHDFPAFYAISGVVCSPTNGTCDAAHLTGAGIDLGSLAGGASVTITVSGTASPNNTTDVGAHPNTAYACDTAAEATCVHASATITVTLTHDPAIHIVKTASTNLLAYPGGPVTYTYAVTNTGNVPLSNVTVVDDKCSNVVFDSGDANENGLLDLTETWMFHCTMTITATTINVATATGHDGDTTVTDTDTQTVTVAQPEVTPTPTPTHTPKITLPPTSTLDGNAPTSQSGNGLLVILAAVGILMLLAGLLVPAPARSRRRSNRR